MKTSDVVISGGGVPGLTLGSILARAGLRVCVVDPAVLPDPSVIKPTGRTSALMEDSLNILEQVGLWSAVKDQSTDLRQLAIIDQTQHVTFAAAELDKPRFGSNIVNGLLLAHAAKTFKAEANGTLIHSTVRDFETGPSAVTVTLANGDVLKSPLLIGADGRNSIVRIASGIQCREHDYDQMALTVLLAHTKPHHHTSTEFHRPGGPFTLVPMPGNSSSLVWLDHRATIEDMLKLNRRDLEQRIQDLSEGLLGEITLQTSPEAWPLKVMQAKSYTAPRVALVAEAAHVLSPIGAQGLNLSLRDIAALAHTLLQAASCGLDIGSPAVLKKYASSRDLDISLRVAGSHLFNEIVATESPVLASLRQLGLRVVSSVSPLRKLAMQEGLTNDASTHQASTSGRTTRAKVRTSTR